MTVFVLDNSVTMRWFFDGSDHGRADVILHDLMAVSSEAVVPVLWRYEVSAVLARAQLKGQVPAQHVMDFMEDLQSLPITLDEAGGDRIFSDVHRLAVSYRLTSYDAAYLELALRRSLPIATLDADLEAACNLADVRII